VWEERETEGLTGRLTGETVATFSNRYAHGWLVFFSGLSLLYLHLPASLVDRVSLISFFALHSCPQPSCGPFFAAPHHFFFFFFK
jgi:hypothetical protein